MTMKRTSFTPAPGIDVSDADASESDVKSPKTFYAGTEAKKTGTMPTKAITAASDAYEEGYHAGNPGGLDAIDTDLAPANIKSGVTIFGKVGTYTGANPDHDIQGLQADIGTTATASAYYDSWSIGAGGDQTLVTDTITVVAGACVEGCGVCLCFASAIDKIKLRLFIDGVQKAESGWISATAFRSLVALMGYTENISSGNRVIYLSAHNYDTEARNIYRFSSTVFGGSVKQGA